MLKTITQLEHKINDRTFHFLCDPSSPLNEVKDALLKFVQYVGQIEDTVKARQEQEKAEEQPAEEQPAEEQPPSQ